jgi:hypothetical protein
MNSILILKIRNFIVLLDSTCYKLSKDTLFAIFEPMNRKIWNLQDSTESRFKILIRNLFESRADAWCVSIGRYRFGRIRDMSHRI